MLKDPISGRPVIIVDSRALSGILSHRCIELALRGDIAGIIAAEPFHKVRIVPMKTASGGSVVCAFVPEKLTVLTLDKTGKKEKRAIETDALFAPATLCLASDKTATGCAALIPPII
jgi:hypothetical protein